MVSSLSCHRCRSNRTNVAGLSALGLALPFASQIQGQFDTIAAQLKQTQDAINATNQLIIQGNQAGIDMTTEAQQNMQAQNKLNEAVSQFTTLYRAVFGTVPPGLSALGLGPVLTIGAVLASLAVIAGIIAVAWKFASAAQDSAKAKLAQQGNIGVAQTNLQDALARGDQAAIDKWTAVLQANTANPPGSGESLGDFLKNNLPWIALGIGGLFLAKEVL